MRSGAVSMSNANTAASLPEVVRELNDELERIRSADG